MNRLKSKVALVTGANTGIGFGIARRFAEEGASVVLAGRDQARLAEAAEAIGSQVATCAYDALVEEDADKAVAFAVERFGRLDICVPNAGGSFSKGAALPDLSGEAWRKTMALNADAAFYLFRAASRVMIPQRSGSLVAISSVSSIRAMPSLDYAAAKGAVNALVVSLSVPLGKHGIRVNAILPGPIDTRALRQFITTPEIEQGFVTNVPLGRLGTIAEIGALAAFLASDDAAYVNGQLISADGGMSQHC